MLRVAEAALSRGVKSGGQRKGFNKSVKLQEKVQYAQQQQRDALEIREEQCRDLTQAISLLLRAVSQQSEIGWVWRWQENGGRHATNYSTRLRAIETVKPYLTCTDFVFELSGEGLWMYMMLAHSLSVTPSYLWNHLS